MNTVYKYEIPAALSALGAQFVHEFTLALPKEGRVLNMDVQQSRSPKFQIWALVDPEAELSERKFLFLGTGHNTERKNVQYIDSWVTDGLVFHLFEVFE